MNQPYQLQMAEFWIVFEPGKRIESDAQFRVSWVKEGVVYVAIVRQAFPINNGRVPFAYHTPLAPSYRESCQAIRAARKVWRARQ